jgi:MtaA/CmuA family methyltransferase
LIHVTEEGLDSIGLKLHEVHTDAGKMARAAASTFHLAGLPSAVVPLDLCIEAEAIGAKLNFHADSPHPIFPSPAKYLFENCEAVSSQKTGEGRIPLVCDAIRLLKTEVGDGAVIGAFVPGPYTLLSLLVKPDALMLDLKRDPASVHTALDMMANLVTRSALAYHQAGADMLTVHEMGGSPGVLGPKRFETFVMPPLQKLIASLPKPRVLSVCGNTNGAMQLLAQTGADAIHVDQLNDLVASRKALPDTLIFGNIDPVAVLAISTEAQVRQAVSSAIVAGVDAVWPGCDLYPPTPLENLRAMMDVACA